MATIAAAWVPAFIFGNLWALFWVFKMMLTYRPGVQTTMSRWYKKFTKRKHSTQSEEKKVGRKDTEMEIQEIASNFKSARDQNAGTQASDQTQQPPTAPRSIVPDGNGSNYHSRVPDDTHDPAAIKRRVTRIDTILVSGVDLEWKNIGCKYITGSTEKTVLEGVYGRVRPQEMMALMGPSGAGKSTLLDILTMRKTIGTISGEVLMNGQTREGGFVRYSCYVPQEDNFIPTMTTWETLDFYARLTLPRNTTAKERKRCVENVLYMVGLNSQKSTMVGGLLPGGIHLRGLSGGERRRLSIAAGVVSAPSIIFLDEPTSGLDSFAALNVMQYMKTLAQCKSHTVIASIHQPRTGIWNMFDKVTVLSKGRMMYSGDTDRIVSWFSDQLGYGYDNKIHGVVSDWVIDLVSIGFSKPPAFYGNSMRSESEVIDAAKRFYSEYKNLRKADAREEGQEVSDSEDEGAQRNVQATVVRKTTTHYVVEMPQHQGLTHASSSNSSPSPKKKEHRSLIPIFWQGYPTSWMNQFIALTLRSFLNVTRNPADVAGRMLNFTYVGAFIGLVFYNLPDGLGSAFTKLNIIFNTASFYMFIPYTSMSLFTSDRQFYAADVTAKLYDSSAYYLANVVSNFPFATLNAIVYALLVYGMAGLNPEFEAVWRSVLLSIIESLISLQVLHFAAVATHNQDTAFMVAISFTAVNVVVSNFFIPFTQIALSWISWLQYFSAMGYTFNGNLKLEFENRNFTCQGGLDNFDFGNGINETLYKAFPNSKRTIDTVFQVAPGFLTEDDVSDCVFAGDAVLEYYDVTRSYGATLGILIGYLCIMHCLTYMALIFLAKKDKR